MNINGTLYQLGAVINDTGSQYKIYSVKDHPTVVIARANLASEVEKKHAKNTHDAIFKVRESPYVLPFIDSQMDQDIHSIAMPYFREGDLFTYLFECKAKACSKNCDFFDHKRTATLTLGSRNSIIRQILQAVSSVHQLGVFHRDIKAENFLVKEEMGNLTILLTDFGLACADLTDEEQMNCPCGTLQYLSPEILLRGASLAPGNSGKNLSPITVKSDVWATALLIRKIVLNKNPYFSWQPFLRDKLEVYLRDEKKLNVLIKQMEEEVALLGTISPIKRLLSKMLAVDPSARVSSEEALAYFKAQFESK
jgi:serine/threonine protein kinase